MWALQQLEVREEEGYEEKRLKSGGWWGTETLSEGCPEGKNVQGGECDQLCQLCW